MRSVSFDKLESDRFQADAIFARLAKNSYLKISMRAVMKTGLVFVLICVMKLTMWFPSIASAQTIKQSRLKVFPSVMYAPSIIPDRVVLTIAGDPKTSQAVTWRTSTKVKEGLAEIAVSDSGPNFGKKAKQYKAVSQALLTDLSTSHYHTVKFTDLKPGTRYAYRVGDGRNWSEWFQFSTAPAQPDPFSFIYFGDAQNDLRSRWSRVIREAYREAPKAAFMIHAGDLVNNAKSDKEWGEWFDAGDWVNGMTPTIAVPGNHEQVKQKDGTKRLSPHWRPVFAFPENGPDGLEESCYTFVYNNVRFIALNTNEKIAIQTEWLKKVLSENKSQWVICTFHHPLFSTGKGRDNPEVRAAWKPLFDHYKVDLVLQGHDHTYGRTGFSVPSADSIFVKKVKVGKEWKNIPVGGQQIDKDSGTVYVVSVSGPKMYSNTSHKFMRRVAEDTQLFQVISVDGDKLKFEARTAVGDLYDSFILRKGFRGERNRLIEVQPEIAKRLRQKKNVGK